MCITQLISRLLLLSVHQVPLPQFQMQLQPDNSNSGGIGDKTKKTGTDTDKRKEGTKLSLDTVAECSHNGSPGRINEHQL